MTLTVWLHFVLQILNSHSSCCWTSVTANNNTHVVVSKSTCECRHFHNKKKETWEELKANCHYQWFRYSLLTSIDTYTFGSWVNYFTECRSWVTRADMYIIIIYRISQNVGVPVNNFYTCSLKRYFKTTYLWKKLYYFYLF